MNLAPVFELGIFLKNRSGKEDKLGGIPYGFPVQKWPKCASCGRHQDYIGQFHSSNLMNLGKDGNTLYLFQCQNAGSCFTWDYSSGANAAIIIEANECTGHPTELPAGVEVEPEGIIVGWEEVTPDAWKSYAGPAPSYGDNHVPELEPKGRFLIQLIGLLEFKGPAPTAEESGAELRYYSGGPYGTDKVRVENPPTERKHYGIWSRGQVDVPGRPSQISVYESGNWAVEWANFGSGTAYIFIDFDNIHAYFFSES